MSAHTDTGGDASLHERRRAAALGELPRWYSPTLHLVIPGLIGLAVMIAAASRIHGLAAIELVTVPVTLVFALGFEWRVHQLVLHRRTPLLETLYERHELHHHVVYTYDDMRMRSRDEYRLVLMPAYGIVLSGIVDAPIVLLLSWLAGTNVAALFLVTSMVFFLSYEWLHLAYHLPEDSFVGRLRIIAWMREHHRRHHDPRLMKRWNFNVTIPLFDWIHGATWTPAREAERAARRERRAAAAASRAPLADEGRS